MWTGDPSWHSFCLVLPRFSIPFSFLGGGGDLYLSFLLPIETLVLSSRPTLTWPQKWGSLDPQENGEGTLGKRDINEPGYGVALERQARVAERLGWGVTCSLSDSDGGAFSREWGGGTTGVGVDRVHSGGFSSISFF